MSPRKRETWSSRAGFLIATLGCAVGVGNIWRFAYVAGENGGAVFLLAYVASIALIGIPVVLAEFALGSRSRSDIVAAFGPRGRWRAAGALALAAAFLILSYYAVVAGWAARYLVEYASGSLGTVTEDFGSRFAATTGNPYEAVSWQAAFLLATAAVVACGVQRGIERANRVLMPLLGAIILFLAIYAVTLPGAQRGLDFLFRPDWSVVLRPELYLAALGQAFFSLGVGTGVLLTYASYTSERERLGSAAVTIAVGDTVFALFAGLAIFPAVFAFGLNPAEGPALAFVTLPQLFSGMPGGRWMGLAFFLLLTAAAITSAVSLIEVPVAWLMRRFALSRFTSTSITAVAVFAAGVPSALSLGVLGFIDTLTSNLLLPVASIALLIYLGWVMPRSAALSAAALASSRTGRAWFGIVRYLAPAAIAIMLVWRALS